MKKILDQTQAALLSTIQEIKDEELQATSGENSLGEELAGYAIHEAYHAGQLGTIKGIIQAK